MEHLGGLHPKAKRSSYFPQGTCQQWFQKLNVGLCFLGPQFPQNDKRMGKMIAETESANGPSTETALLP